MRRATLWSPLILVAVLSVPLPAQDGSANRVWEPTERLSHPELDECSGFALLDGWFWALNDSGGDPALYRSKTLDFAEAEKLMVPGVENRDWEALTTWGEDLLIGEIGDNERQRDDIELYRVRPAGNGLELVARHPIRYPDGRHDAEALFVHGGKAHIVCKDRGEGTHVYRFDRLKSAEELADGEVNEATRIATLELDPGQQITAAAVHPESGPLVLLCYSFLYRYPLEKISGRPAGRTLIGAGQCEALTFRGDELIITNEQRDVFRLPDFLSNPPDQLLPARPIVTLPTGEARPDLELDGKGRDWVEEAVPIPLRDAGDGHLRWLQAGGRLLIQGRVPLGEAFRKSDLKEGVVGSGLLLLFSQEDSLTLTAEQQVLAVLAVDDGLQVVSIDMAGGGGLEPLAGARAAGGAGEGWMQLELDLPAAGLVAEPTFRLEVLGYELGREHPVCFAGPDITNIYKPYLWGRVEVEE